MRNILIVVLGLLGLLLAVLAISLWSGKNIPASTTDCLTEQRLRIHRVAIETQLDQEGADTNLTLIRDVKRINSYLPVY
ncbi:MAG: hypothetical protein ABI840_08475 [bacterium]